MTDEKWTMPTSGIAISDPKAVARFLCKHYLVMVSKANRDQLVEFCHLVVLLELKDRSIPEDLLDLVNDVMKDPQPNQVQEAVQELNEYADSLYPDPRKKSGDVADAWRRSKKIKEGKEVHKLDESLLSQSSSSIAPSKSQIPIQAQVWPQTQGRLDKPTSEIRCGMYRPTARDPVLRVCPVSAVPSLSMVGNLQNIIRYAATVGFNFPLGDGKRPSKPKKVDLNCQAMFFSKSLDMRWALRDKATTLGEVVEHSRRLQIVNTKLKNLAVALAVRSPPELWEHFIFDVENPRELVSTLRNVASETQVLRCILEDENKFLQTRFLTILPEEVAVLSAASSNHNPKVNPTRSGANLSPGGPPPSSFEPVLHPAAPPVVHSQLRPQLANARPPEIVGAQAPVDHRIENPRSSSPASSVYTDAQEDVGPPQSQIHHDSKTRNPARVTPSAPSNNSMAPVSASSSGSIVMVDPLVAQTAILSKPENQTSPTPDAPTKKRGSDSFYRRVLRKIGF
ncbi:hypothetical protein FS837_006265 [Tulasnella sp. UAMH 9824]|nr:hypothetical protein FS837_006265 [Tulasnella sp. UAMH 9824]